MNNPDYPDTLATTGGDISLHLPFGILALAFAIFIGVELRSAGKQADVMKWQLSNLDKQADALKSAQAQLSDLIVQRNEVVKNANSVQGQYMNLFNELIDMSVKGDKDAKEVVEKWGIKRNGPAAPAAEPAPAAEKK